MAAAERPLPATRYRAPRVSVFNHKGGVGKTTLTVNLAIAIAEMGKNVLLVDSDPQCNLTSYLVEDAVVNDILDTSDGEDGRTLWSALKPIVEATGDFRLVSPIETAYGVELIPGDIRLAEFEAELGTLWSECFMRRIRGFRGTAALSLLVNEVARQRDADIVIYDAGPNIGPLNRVISLDCDYFFTPVACDQFSLRALKTLGHTLAQWVSDWRSIEDLAPPNVDLLPGKPKPVGYVVQRFRVYGGQPAHTYATFLPQIEKSFSEDVLTVLARVDKALVGSARSPLRIGEIQDYGSVANLAQREGVPIWRSSQGTQMQRDAAHSDFMTFASTFMDRIEME